MLLLGLAAAPCFAATASRPGGSGMTWMRTADTLNNGDLLVYDQLGVNTYVILDSNLNDFDTFNNVGVNYGLFDPLELDFQTTYMANDQDKTSGIRSYKGIVKFRVLGDKYVDHYAVTLSVFKTASPANNTKKIGSGETENGAEINASYYGEDLNLHLTLGSATTDAKYYNPDIVYYSVDKQYADLGVEFKVSERYIFGIEAIQERSDNVYFDKNQLFAFSLQYKPGKKWDFDFGAAFGVPADRSEPAQSFYAGFVYHLDDNKRRPAVGHHAGAGQHYQTAPPAVPVPNAKPAEPPAFSKRPASEAKKTPRKKAAAAHYKYRVRIKNATGSAATAQRVAAFLKRHGYGIASIQSVAHRSKTEIRYLRQNSKQALELALKLPGNQDLRVMSGLAKGVDFDLLIGSDIVGNIR